jgi:hypothetical protein
MTTQTTPQSRPDSRPGRRIRQEGEGGGSGKKPKKVNSEARKQQNRIASRNYRTFCPEISTAGAAELTCVFYAGEKRKRKLQYLQQLIKDGSNDEQTPEASPQPHEAHLRSISAEYDAGSSSSPYMLPTNGNFASVISSSTAAPDQSLPAHTASFGSHLLPTTQSYPSFEPPWNSAMYQPPPPPNMTYTPNWVPSIEYSSRIVSRSDSFHPSLPLGPSAFEQATSPYHHPRQFAPTPNQYDLGPPYGQYDESQIQTSDVPSVSLPTPSSYFQGHYSGPH